MGDFAGKTFLVVGASGVFGALLVAALTRRGASVYGTATTNESAARIPATGNPNLLLNLEQPQSIDSVASWLSQTIPHLDGLILASGRVGFGTSESITNAQFEQLMRVNFLGQAALVNRLIPMLRGGVSLNGSAVVAAITGVVAEKSFPGMSAYSSSKSAMSSFLETIRTELRRDKVQILEARPGHTETGLATRPLFGNAPAMPAGMQPEHVVEVILGGMENGETVIPSTAF